MCEQTPQSCRHVRVQAHIIIEKQHVGGADVERLEHASSEPAAASEIRLPHKPDAFRHAQLGVTLMHDDDPRLRPREPPQRLGHRLGLVQRADHDRKLHGLAGLVEGDPGPSAHHNTVIGVDINHAVMCRVTELNFQRQRCALFVQGDVTDHGSGAIGPPVRIRMEP